MAVLRPPASPIETLLKGSLSSDDGNANENGKKAKGLDWPNNNLARASHFFAYFFAVTERLLRENA